MALTQITASVQASESRGSLPMAAQAHTQWGKEYAGKPKDSITKTSLTCKNQLLGKRPKPLEQTAGISQIRHTGPRCHTQAPVFQAHPEKPPWKNSWTAGVSGAGTGGRQLCWPRAEGPDHSIPVGTPHPHPGAARPPAGGHVGALGGGGQVR